MAGQQRRAWTTQDITQGDGEEIEDVHERNVDHREAKTRRRFELARCRCRVFGGRFRTALLGRGLAMITIVSG
jgi:hypothetical protein